MPACSAWLGVGVRRTLTPAETLDERDDGAADPSKDEPEAEESCQRRLIKETAGSRVYVGKGGMLSDDERSYGDDRNQHLS
jgi:hypothetical protein